MTDDVQRRWDLWHLQTMFPGWGPTERAALLRAGEAYDDRQQRLFGAPSRALDRFGPSARRVLADHPDLASGLTLSLHLGPYSLAPVPWLITGRDIHVLVNRTSLAEIRPLATTLHDQLGLPGRLHWISIEGTGFAVRLARALRAGQPVLAYLDGNDGLDGCEGTLRHGIPFDLPGRRIRVRTGLARLALRLGCEVHSLVTVFDASGGFAWQRGPTWRWPAGVQESTATRELFGWAFGLIRRHPAQWRAWNMLTGVCDAFRHEADGDAVPTGRVAAALQAPLLRDAPLVWRRPATVWPGDMLEDVQAHCFYDAQGLSAADLEQVARCAPLTAARLAARLGEAWVRAHLPRLVALGFIGPAAGETAHPSGPIAG